MALEVAKKANDQSKKKTKIPRARVFWRYFLRGLKKIIMFFFSHIGLTGGVVAYNILGGWIFMKLEAPHEQELRQQINDIRYRYVNLILNTSVFTNNISYTDDTYNTKLTYDYIVEFEKEIVQFIDKTKWNGLDDEVELQWSYTGALLYSVTVVTTIGYGHIAPKTNWGRIVTIIYAVFGIPLTLLCLRTIGSFMAGIFKFIYKHFCYRLYQQWRRLRNYIQKMRREQAARFLQAKIALEELIEKSNELWKPTEDSVENAEDSLNYIEDDIQNAINKDLHKREIKKDRHGMQRWKSRRHNQKKPNLFNCIPAGKNHNDVTKNLEDSHKKELVDKNNESKEDSEDTVKEESDIEVVPENKDTFKTQPEGPPHDIRVPVLVSLLIIAGYIFLGAVLFSLWEKNWDYLIGSYFCFVTLSTIGFGDFVPGSDVDSWSSAEKQAICTLYLMFGLAMIAMCFKLMQQEVKLKFIDLGKRIGLIDDVTHSSFDDD